MHQPITAEQASLAYMRLLLLLFVITQVQIRVTLPQIHVAGILYIIERTSATAAPTARV